MLVGAVVVSVPERQLGLDAMEQPVNQVLLARIDIAREHGQGEAEPACSAPGDGAVRETEKAGRRPSGSGWLVARVPVAGSTITIGPQSDTPHNRPASRSQSFVTSSNHRWASLGWTCASADAAVPSSTSSGRVLKWCRMLIRFPPCRSLAQTLAANYADFQFKTGLTLDQRRSV
jgi:hypothetical protein